FFRSWVHWKGSPNGDARGREHAERKQSFLHAHAGHSSSDFRARTSCSDAALSCSARPEGSCGQQRARSEDCNQARFEILDLPWCKVFVRALEYGTKLRRDLRRGIQPATTEIVHLPRTFRPEASSTDARTRARAACRREYAV